jgi:hypothetical protein
MFATSRVARCVRRESCSGLISASVPRHLSVIPIVAANGEYKLVGPVTALHRVMTLRSRPVPEQLATASTRFRCTLQIRPSKERRRGCS